jgi:hypothetical protein
MVLQIPEATRYLALTRNEQLSVTCLVGGWRGESAMSEGLSELLHCDAVGAGGACFEGGVEVQFEARVLGDGVVRDFEDVDFVVAFEVNNAFGVFVEEVVRYDEALLVAAEHDVVRAGILAEADDRDLLRFEAVGDVEHHHLARHEGADEEPVTTLRSGHDLAHSAGYGRVDVRLDGGEIEDGGAGAAEGIDEVDVAVEHACGVSVAVRVFGEHFDVHGALRRAAAVG